MRTTTRTVWRFLAIGVLLRGVFADSAFAQDVQGDLVRLINAYTVVVDVKGNQQTIAGNPPGIPGKRATLTAVKARCTVDALPKGGLVVFRGKLNWDNFYEIEASELRLELGEKPVDTYIEGTIDSRGKPIGTVTYATANGVSVRELSENATLEIAAVVASTDPLVVQVTPGGMRSIFATVNNRQSATHKVAGAKFKLNLKGGEDARVIVDLGQAVHLVGERPNVQVWLDKATGVATQITLMRKELIVSAEMKNNPTKKPPATVKKSKPTQQAE